MKIKVSETSKIQLDWLVAKCEGYVEQGVYGEPTRIDGDLHLYYLGTTLNAAFRPTTDWSQGGPILEREKIGVDYYNTGKPLWIAGIAGMFQQATGPTPLVAAMRCLVASKLGDAVEVPDELGEQP